MRSGSVFGWWVVLAALNTIIGLGLLVGAVAAVVWVLRAMGVIA